MNDYEDYFSILNLSNKASLQDIKKAYRLLSIKYHPDKNHNVPEESAYFQNFSGRLGMHPKSTINFLKFIQYGKSPVNPPFKMNEEQHFTLEKPSRDRCEKARIGDYCPKFYGDNKTPQF